MLELAVKDFKADIMLYTQWDKGNSHSYYEHMLIMNEKARNATREKKAENSRNVKRKYLK